jgi:hypothetical protein
VVKGTNVRSGDDVRIKHYIRTFWYDYSIVGVVIKRERIQVKATLLSILVQVEVIFFNLKTDGQKESLQVKSELCEIKGRRFDADRG